jgi:hypothetical protein
MKLLQVIPKVFYEDVRHGLELFVDTLGFKVGWHDPNPPFYVISRDTATLILLQEPELAKLDRPEIRISTDDIETLYAEVKAKNPQLLHPNSKIIKTQPWGLREFALLDGSGVCVIIQQPVNE